MHNSKCRGTKQNLKEDLKGLHPQCFVKNVFRLCTWLPTEALQALNNEIPPTVMASLLSPKELYGIEIEQTNRCGEEPD